MIKFAAKETITPSESVSPKPRIKQKRTVTEEKQPINKPQAIISHIKDTEELLEYVVVKINELEEKNGLLEEEIKLLKNKPEITIEDIEPKAFKRKIVLNRDDSGKIIGADVIDSID